MSTEQCPKCKRFMRKMDTANPLLPSAMLERFQEKWPDSSETDYRCVGCGEEYTFVTATVVLSERAA